MTNIFISVVSHNSDALIIESNVLSVLAKNFTVVIKCNTKPSTQLLEYAEKSGITLLNEKYGLGFSQNNNYVYDYCRHNLCMSSADFFLVLNPDVIIDVAELVKLHDIVERERAEICTINLFKDKEKKHPENSIKKFPSLLAPWSAFFNRARLDVYDKSEIKKPIPIDWAAGSFLLFRVDVYQSLHGFNEGFFMYFEDVDICRRARRKNIEIIYYPNIEAVHIGAYKNRNILSRHFLWYVRSYLRYHFSF
ncbi:glycosyltransferase [Dickeya lacustris]|uniref:Glycosyltransferase n=1 Tax=Dickeya lacustris TaxID=2259638 RepID=A0ABY8GBB9_9GAMM|nr:glycosyltransferase [Dickeya lacustris]WFN57164.1 glycosyltransferase [Dickeya lacustris]